jgi:hypothetical protein
MSRISPLPGAVSEEELSLQKMAATRKRFISLLVTLAILVTLRIIIKDPPKPKIPDRSKREFRALPGVLDNLPVSEQMKLTPQMVSALREADLKEQMKRAPKKIEGPYVPGEVPMENLQEKVEYERLLAQFEEKRRKMLEEHKVEVRDLSKDTLVMFRTGGYIKAEDATIGKTAVEINYSKGFSAKLTRNMVKKIQENAVDWEEPVPAGFVKLKPAKGITVIVAKGTSEKITVLKYKKDDEI